MSLSELRRAAGRLLLYLWTDQVALLLVILSGAAIAVLLAIFLSGWFTRRKFQKMRRD